MPTILLRSALLAVLSVTGLLPQPTPASRHLAVCGRALCGADGSPFSWRGVTGFGLVDLVADDREAEARLFMAWAARTGFTVVRVLAMNHGWMDLSPADGRRALPRTLALAREHGLHVQVVALAGTDTPAFGSDVFLQQQVQAVATLCAAADNCVLELANEPYHSSQAALDDPVRMRRLQREVPSKVPVAWGAARNHRSDQMSGGGFVVAHLARGGTRWERVGRVPDLADLSRRTGKFVVDSEPIGAAETPQASRRDNEPGAFFAQGLLTRMHGVGATFHCEDCLTARVPAPVQQRCAEAFVAGATLPSPAKLTAVSAGDPDAPLAQPASGGTVRTFVATGPSEGIVLVLGASTPVRPAWRDGWKAATSVSQWNQVQAWRLVKAR